MTCTHTLLTPAASLQLVIYLRHRAGRGSTFVLNDDARVHFWMDAVHQDHKPEMLVNLEYCRPHQHCANDQLEMLTATAAYTFPDSKGNHVDVGQLYLALFQVP